MKVVLLCGGYGTRIRDVSIDLPKPMIPIGNNPILWHILKTYAHWGYRDFVLCLGYKSEIIKDYFLRYKQCVNDFTIDLKNHSIEFNTSIVEEDWRITLAETGLHTFTGARVKRVKQYVENEEIFMLTYGDGVGDINVSALLDFHVKHGKVMTVTGVRPPGRFGELSTEGNLVTGFNEKPQATGGWISGGYFVCNKNIFDYLPDNGDLILEEEPMKLLAEKQELMVFKHEGFWHPMDTSREYQLLNNLWNSGKALWKVWS